MRSPRMTTSTSELFFQLSSPSPASSPIIRSPKSQKKVHTIVAIIQIPYQYDDYSGVEVSQDHGGIQEPGATVCPRQEERRRENHCKQFIHQKTMTETETKTDKYKDKGNDNLMKKSVRTWFPTILFSSPVFFISALPNNLSLESFKYPSEVT